MSYTRAPPLVEVVEDEETQSSTELTANFVDVWTLTIADDRTLFGTVYDAPLG